MRSLLNCVGRLLPAVAVSLAWNVVACGPASAHDRTTSYSTWEIRGRAAHVIVRLALLDVTRFPWAARANVDEALGAYLTGHLQLRAGESACAVVDGPRSLSAASGRKVVEWSMRCPDTGTFSIRSDLLMEVAPAHLHFARVSRDGGEPLERVFSEREPVWRLQDPIPDGPREHGASSLVDYIQLGVEHILSGYDHLAFLLALILIGGSLGEVARVVTGFTVAHSLTLGLTVLGYVRPQPAPVEALIGLSIALVAAENIWLTGSRGPALSWVLSGVLVLLALLAATGHGRVPVLTLAGLALFVLCYFGLLRSVAHASGLRWAVAFIFGLVHGFGFAGVLVEAGLPTERLVPALFGFNVGVELGQLAAVAAVWPLLYGIEKRSSYWRLTVLNYGSAAVLALGVFWFVRRTFG